MTYLKKKSWGNLTNINLINILQRKNDKHFIFMKKIYIKAHIKKKKKAKRNTARPEHVKFKVYSETKVDISYGALRK